MPSTKTARGRPRGTGLNDRAVLQSVIDLVAANPEMKPTTAIKSIGVTDPSAIRRLRDKFHVVHKQADAGIPTKKTLASLPAGQPVRSMALKAVAEPVRSAPLKASSVPVPAARSAKASPKLQSGSATAVAKDTADKTSHQLVTVSAVNAQPAARDTCSNWFSLWAELSLQSISASFSAQWIIYDQVLHSPPVTIAFESHAAMSEFAAAWCATSPASSKSIH